jgi:hypothetical protein
MTPVGLDGSGPAGGAGPTLREHRNHIVKLAEQPRRITPGIGQHSIGCHDDPGFGATTLQMPSYRF